MKKTYTLKSSGEKPDLKIDYQKQLNNEQYQAITSANGPCLVLAGAGSGKTRTLVYRLLYLLEHNIKPSRIMLVTFTNRAAREMLNRVEILYGQKPKGLWGGTFHSIGNRILRIYGQHIGIDKNFTILDNEDSKNMVKSCLAGVNTPQDKYFPKADLIKKMISLSVNLGQSIGQVVKNRFSQVAEEYIPLIEQMAKNYEEKKKKAKALDFDDLLYQWNQLLLKSDEVREKLATKFQYILVDEYQDTNYLQGEIVAHLAGIEKNIMVVGDDAQSIYSFRGADVSNILEFPKVFPDCQTFKLETNYRSTPQILALANNSILHNQFQFKKKLTTDKKSGPKPALVSVQDAYQQAEFICQRIQDLVHFSGGKKGPDPFCRDQESLNKVAVLFRAHYQSLELEMEMNKKNIPYVMRGGVRFFEQAHIKDVVAYLKILNNLYDELSWQRILQLQPGIGGANADKIWQIIAGLANLNQVVSHSMTEVLNGRVLAGWQKAINLIKMLNEIDKNDLPSLLDKILSSGYKDHLKNYYENWQDRIDDLEQLVVFADSYDSLENFLADVALSEGFKGETARGLDTFSEKKGSDPLNNSDEAVVLSTIHQAKGLEWPVVFVMGLADGQFPSIQTLDKPQQMEEERRLFYVATTRAKDELYLIYPMFSHRSGNLNQISQFVKELPKNVFEEWQLDEKLSAVDDDFLDDGQGVIQLDDQGEVIKSSSDISKEFWQRVINKRKKKI